MFVLRFSWIGHVKELVTPLLKFWEYDFSFLGNKPRDDPVYLVSGKSGCYSEGYEYKFDGYWVVLVWKVLIILSSGYMIGVILYPPHTNPPYSYKVYISLY